MPGLPDELVEEVLSQLPVKNLIRFRGACKAWNLLTRSKQFVELHLGRAAADSDSQRVLISFNNSISVDGEEDEQVCTLHCPLDWHEMNFVYYVDFTWSCNGLMCVVCFGNAAVDDRHFLWNPSTREVKELSNEYRVEICSLGVYGFGYDALSDDYKIVRAFPIEKDDTGAPNAGTDSSSDGFVIDFQVEVFSCKSNFWRRIEDYHSTTDFRGCCDNMMQGVYSNGAVHWLGERQGLRSSVIVTFNLNTESFEELEVKEQVPTLYETFYMSFTVVGGTPCIYAERQSNPGKIEIWGMEKCGGMTSWTNVISISYDIEDPPFEDSLEPVCFTKNGELLTRIDGVEGVLYNPSDETFRDRLEYFMDYARVRLYVESLVSPNDVIGEARD